MEVQHPARPIDQPAGADRRWQWLERVDREFEMAEAWEPSCSPDELVGQIDRMVEVAAGADALSVDDKIDIQDRGLMVKRRVYQAYLGILLDRALLEPRHQERGDLIRQADEALGAASALGLGEAVRQDVRARIDLVRRTWLADAPAPARPNEGSSEGPLGVGPSHELRGYARWRTPRLEITIDGHPCATIDWSLNGALLGAIADRGWKCGQSIEVGVGLTGGQWHVDRMVVVRYSPEQGRLAIRTRRFASVFMAIRHDCDAAGIIPL